MTSKWSWAAQLRWADGNEGEGRADGWVCTVEGGTDRKRRWGDTGIEDLSLMSAFARKRDVKEGESAHRQRHAAACRLAVERKRAQTSEKSVISCARFTLA